MKLKDFFAFKDWLSYRQKLNANKQRFLQEIEPKWIAEAKKNGKLIEL